MSITEYTDALSATRELDYRLTDGIEVRLLWNSRSGKTTVAVFDQKTNEHFVLDVPAGHARDAFQHPFAYAA